MNVVRRADVIAAFVAGVPLMALSAMVALLSVPGTRAAVLVSACAVAHVALAWRRALSGFLVISAAFAVQVAVTGMFLVLPSVAIFPVALFSCTAHAGRRLPLAVGLAGAGAVAARFATDPSVVAAGLGPDPWLLLGLLVAVVVAAWGLGLHRRTQLAYVALLEERARDAAEQAALAERARIAREMHDIVAHALAVIVSQARGGQYALDRAAEILATVERTGRQALAEMRGLVGVLRAAELSPQPALADLPELMDRTRAAGLPVELAQTGPPVPLGPGAELAVYRLVQEALTNTLKHAGPGAAATVSLDWRPGELVVAVVDDGRPGATAEGGNGLAGMRERLGAVGGSLDAGPRETGGYAVSARLPLGER